jgi:hypothetical protein
MSTTAIPDHFTMLPMRRRSTRPWSRWRSTGSVSRSGSTARSGRSWRSTPNCPAASMSSSSASRSATEPPGQPDLPAGTRKCPVTINARPDDRELAEPVIANGRTSRSDSARASAVRPPGSPRAGHPAHGRRARPADAPRRRWCTPGPGPCHPEHRPPRPGPRPGRRRPGRSPRAHYRSPRSWPAGPQSRAGCSGFPG